MVCPHCGKNIENNSIECPYCKKNIEHLVPNDFKKDGFIALTDDYNTTKDTSSHDIIHTSPNYYTKREYSIFVIALIVVMAISAGTAFGLQYLKSLSGQVKVQPITIDENIPTTAVQTTTAPIENTVKSYSIKNFYGSWKNSNDKENKNFAIPYYDFKKNNTVTVYYGSMEYSGSYEDLSKGSKHVINITISSYLSGTYTYKYTGNQKDGYKMELKSINDNNNDFTLIKADAKISTVEPSNDKKIDKNLCYKWKSQDNSSIYLFKSNGICIRKIGNIKLTGTWSITDDDVMTIKYMRSSLETTTVDYMLVKKHLIINDKIYNKVK